MDVWRATTATTEDEMESAEGGVEQRLRKCTAECEFWEAKAQRSATELSAAQGSTAQHSTTGRGRTELGERRADSKREFLLCLLAWTRVTLVGPSETDEAPQRAKGTESRGAAVR